jgi:hypothetical protein
MDHKLAIVIVPRESKDPVQASRALLERFQKVPLDSASVHFEQRFRYKRVRGWFDGLVNGDVGQERWSTVLRMLLDGASTNAQSPFSGFGPETGPETEGRIEADNTIELDEMWPLAPCSIIVTPAGEWVAHANPDLLDKQTPFEETNSRDEHRQAWAKVKRALFRQHRGATAVAWDLSWHFIGTPVESKKSRNASMARAWGSRRRNQRQGP